MKKSLKEQKSANLDRVSGIKRRMMLIDIGIPPIFHGIRLSRRVEDLMREFLHNPVTGANSGILLHGVTSQESYKLGSRLGEIAVDERIGVALIGLRALHSVYKASFREPDSRTLIRSRLENSAVIVFTNVEPMAVGIWEQDTRDLSWFRGVITHRVSMMQKTAFCTSDNLKEDSLGRLLGPENKEFYKRLYGIEESNSGKNRQSVSHKNPARTAL